MASKKQHPEQIAARAIWRALRSMPKESRERLIAWLNRGRVLESIECMEQMEWSDGE